MTRHVGPLGFTVLRKSKLAVDLHEVLGIENPHHELFAESRRHRRQPELDFIAIGRHRFQSPVLRSAPLDDVHSSEHLDAARHGRHYGCRYLVNVVEYAVDTETHVSDLAPRLELDVART